MDLIGVQNTSLQASITQIAELIGDPAAAEKVVLAIQSELGPKFKAQPKLETKSSAYISAFDIEDPEPSKKEEADARKKRAERFGLE